MRKATSKNKTKGGKKKDCPTPNDNQGVFWIQNHGSQKNSKTQARDITMVLNFSKKNQMIGIRWLSHC